MTEKQEIIRRGAPSNTSLFIAKDLSHAGEIAEILSGSTMVPEQYRGDQGKNNIVVALEMAARCGASPLAVMQNMNVIQGRPSWSSSFIIATINSCGRFSPLKFKFFRGKKEEIFKYKYKYNNQQYEKEISLRNDGCRAYCKDLETGEVLEGTLVDLRLAVLEGWWTKPGSKWPTMTDHMLSYRSAAFFGRLYCPDLLMGMQAQDEILDVVHTSDKGDEIVVDSIPTEARAKAVQDERDQTAADDLHEELFINQETEDQKAEGAAT
jgi:hypothetical protein